MLKAWKTPRPADTPLKRGILPRYLSEEGNYFLSPKGWQAEPDRVVAEPDGVVNETAASRVAVIAVKKDRIAKDGDYNLTGERYREIETHKNQKWPMVELGEVCEIKTGKKDVNHSTIDGEHPFFTCALEQYKSPDFAFDTEAILLPGNGANVGKAFYYKGKFQAYQRTYVLFNFQKIFWENIYFTILMLNGILI